MISFDFKINYAIKRYQMQVLISFDGIVDWADIYTLILAMLNELSDMEQLELTLAYFLMYIDNHIQEK